MPLCNDVNKHIYVPTQGAIKGTHENMQTLLYGPIFVEEAKYDPQMCFIGVTEYFVAELLK